MKRIGSGAQILLILLTGGLLFAAPSNAAERCLTHLKVANTATAEPVYGLPNPAFQHNTHYTVDTEIPGEDIKDQCNLSTCHLHTWASKLEHEYLLEHGEPLAIDMEYLSIMHWARESIMSLQRGTKDKLAINLGATTIESRDAILWSGIMPKGVWTPKHSFKEAPLSSRLAEYIQNIVGKARWEMDREKDDAKKAILLDEAETKIFEVLNNVVGESPKEFMFQGETYTPQTFQKKFFPQLDRPLVTILISFDPDKGPRVRHEPFETIYILPYKQVETIMKALLDQRELVYVGYNHVPEYINNKTGAMSLKALTVPEDATPMTREQRAHYGSNSGAHAAQLLAYDQDPKTKQFIKWGLKSSWSDKAGDHGHFHAYEDYWELFLGSISFYADAKVTLPQAEDITPRNPQLQLPFPKRAQGPDQ